ncbi:MAG: hypothetical protein HN590_14100, partial [Calditrichaeota bacterium]|nr:hypothetical protein [Calditrichota bacterium]
MKKRVYLLVSIFIFCCAISAVSSEKKCREIAQREYPDDIEMQNYIFDQQCTAFRYMTKVEDMDVKDIALREYPEDFSMQKYTYDQQNAGKRYMTTVRDSQVEQIALREYPFDFSMQKYTYDQQ